MVDEIRVTNEGGTEVHRIAGESDEVEGTLVVEPRELEPRKLDLLAAVREHPLRALGLVFGAGLALGLLTGGRGDHLESAGEEEDEEEDRNGDEDEEDGTSPTDRLRSFVSEHLTGIATEAVQQLVHRVMRK